MKRRTAIVIIPALLAGCASSPDYASYVAAQSEANRLHVESQKPLVRLTAQPGQAITGLAGVEVYMPNAAPTIQQSRPNEWAGVVGQALGVVGAVGGVYVGGKAAAGLLDSASRFVPRESPLPNVSTVTNTTTVGANSGANSGNSGRVSGTTMTDSTSTPTVVTQPAPVIVTQPAPVIVQPVVTP